MSSYEKSEQPGFISSKDSLSSREDNEAGPVSRFIKSFAIEKDIDLESGQRRIVSLEDRLKDRHIRMIAIGGCIGSGLFISSGAALASSGPGSLIISYIVIGILMFSVIQSLGELTSAFPVQGNFLIYNTRFIDESWGFAMNWNYCLQWLVSIPLSLVSASLTIDFWGSNINTAVWVAIFYVLICFVNIFGVKGYGEMEFVCSSIKVLAIVGFCILSVVIICGGGHHGYIGARYWNNPGSFNHGFHGLCSVFVNAAFSFAGTELCALAAGESSNPRRALRKAMKQVFWRVTIFYMLSILFVCFLVPYNNSELLSNSSSSASPFVIAIKLSGIEVLPSIFNAVILISVLSVANAAVFASYKPLVSLSEAGHGPKFLAYTDKRGRPIFSIMISLSFGLIGFVCVSSKQTEVFNWLLALSGLSVIFIWLSISVAQIRVRNAFAAQNVSLKELPFRVFGGNLNAYFSILVNVLVLIAQFYVGLFPVSGENLNASTFFQVYLAAPIVAACYLGHKIYTKNWTLLISAKTMDITTGRQEFDQLEDELEEQEYKRRLKNRSVYTRLVHYWC